MILILVVSLPSQSVEARIHFCVADQLAKDYFSLSILTLDLLGFDGESSAHCDDYVINSPRHSAMEHLLQESE